MPVIPLFSLLFGVFNNNFKVFVFIGFVIIYFYNIFALIKGSRVLLMLFFVDFDSNPQSRFHRPCRQSEATRDPSLRIGMTIGEGV